MGHPALDLASKTAVVIGGTSGIGLALEKGGAEAGANLIPSSRRIDHGENAVGTIRGLGRRSLAVASGVTDRATWETLQDSVCAEFGAVDILVNCAGIRQRAPVLEVSEDDWNRILDTNLSGTLRACQIFGRKMIERRCGRLVKIASPSSFAGWRGVAAYGASKAAVTSLTKSPVVEWRPTEFR